MSRKAAEQMYRKWHDKEPRKVERSGKHLPAALYADGKATSILYTSAKWESKEHQYIHDFDSRPTVYSPDGKGASIDPSSYVSSPEVAYLGKVVELTTLGDDGEEYVYPLGGRPKLCSTADGKTLIILASKGIVLIRGGQMRVEPRGIVK